MQSGAEVDENGDQDFTGFHLVAELANRSEKNVCHWARFGCGHIRICLNIFSAEWQQRWQLAEILEL